MDNWTQRIKLSESSTRVRLILWLVWDAFFSQFDGIIIFHLESLAKNENHTRACPINSNRPDLHASHNYLAGGCVFFRQKLGKSFSQNLGRNRCVEYIYHPSKDSIKLKKMELFHWNEAHLFTIVNAVDCVCLLFLHLCCSCHGFNATTHHLNEFPSIFS